jgi:hypothetical protein
MIAGFSISLAYKLLVLQLTLADANFVAQQLGLPCPDPIEAEHVKYLHVTPPSIGFGANMKTTNYAFGYSRTARSIRMLSPAGRDYEGWFLSQYPVWAKTPSLIDTNTAYQMASQWLAKVSVDVPALEQEYRVSVTQLEVEKGVLPKDARDRKVRGATQKLPVYYVRWGAGQFNLFGKTSTSPAAEVEILGTTKQLMEMRITDGDFLRRPRLEVANAEEIACFPDAPLLPLLLSGTNLAAITNLFVVPQEHEMERRSAMLKEANHCLAKLKLFGLSNLEPVHVLQSYVWPPAFGCGGNLRTETYNFRIDKAGRLFSVEPLFRADFDLAGRTIIGTNEAYQVACNRLEAIGISVAKLESRAAARCWRRSLPASGGKPPALLSSVAVVWETDSRPEVEMWLHAATGETVRFVVANGVTGCDSKAAP